LQFYESQGLNFILGGLIKKIKCLGKKSFRVSFS
jgi:hypothetical protein